MSISTPQTGGNRRPSAKPAAGGKPGGGPKTTGAKPTDTDPEAADGTDEVTDTDETTETTPAKSTRPTAKSTGRAAARSAASARPSSGARPAAARSGGGGAKRPPTAPVKVSGSRSWGPIALFTAVAVIAGGIIGFGVYQVFKNSQTWQQKAAAISGVVDYFKTEPDYLKAAQHQYGSITYKQSPPVGGPHNPNWQRCEGDVYPAQIANEHAVHALEHGSVWITYNPSLPAADVAKLATYVKGTEFMLMSPYPGLDKPISLQAWGYQLKLTDPNDNRIAQFIQALRVNDSQESGATCTSGNYITSTGTTPHDIGASSGASAMPSATS
jgi:hypothetical protein